MKVAFVVQRYGMDINGGAELHCRWVAEHMSRHWDVEVLTTQAVDYITWRNAYSERHEIINGVPVRRFPVKRPRDPQRFGAIQKFILEEEHSPQEEQKWLEEEGPLSPELIDYIRGHAGDYAYFIFFSYRYYHSYRGINAVPEKSLLVPTAEHDDIIYLRLFRDLFRKPKGIIYNSYEERSLIQKISGNHQVPGEVVGVGTRVPPRAAVEPFRRKRRISGKYLLYLGRIDENKGCGELFDYFLRCKEETGTDIQLVLVGRNVMKIPSHPDIIYLGFLPEEDKWAALNGARVLMMPSPYESLSMVTLEAWALRKPVLVNGRCDVLKGQCRRSGGGLFYDDYSDFKRALHLMLTDERLHRSLGERGQKYFQTHYTWAVIEKKYLTLVDHIEKTAAMTSSCA
ncbi:MAG: glycosyltransferase family 4 protein [Candidatus Aminicenantes bacterium]